MDQEPSSEDGTKISGECFTKFISLRNPHQRRKQKPFREGKGVAGGIHFMGTGGLRTPSKP